MARTGTGLGAGKQGSWWEEEDSEPKSRPGLAVLAALGPFLSLPDNCSWIIPLGQVLGETGICVVWGVRGKLLTPP